MAFPTIQKAQICAYFFVVVFWDYDSAGDN